MAATVPATNFLWSKNPAPNPPKNAFQAQERISSSHRSYNEAKQAAKQWAVVSELRGDLFHPRPGVTDAPRLTERALTSGAPTRGSVASVARGVEGEGTTRRDVAQIRSPGREGTLRGTAPAKKKVRGAKYHL